MVSPKNNYISMIMKIKVKILNVDIDNISEQELLQQMKRGVLITPNVDQIVKLQKDREFYDVDEIYNQWLSIMRV